MLSMRIAPVACSPACAKSSSSLSASATSASSPVYTPTSLISYIRGYFAAISLRMPNLPTIPAGGTRRCSSRCSLLKALRVSSETASGLVGLLPRCILRIVKSRRSLDGDLGQTLSCGNRIIDIYSANLNSVHNFLFILE